MRLALLADFWPWYDSLPNGEKIALWSTWATVGFTVAGLIVGYFVAKSAAKAGAKAAFEFERAKTTEDIRDTQFSALNYAHYVLCLQANELAIYRHKHFNFDLSKEATIQIPYMYLPDSLNTIPIASLAFIADGVPMALRDIDIVEQKYLSTFEQFRQLRKYIDMYRDGDLRKEVDEAINDRLRGIKLSLDHNLPIFEKVINTVDMLRKQNFADKSIPPSIERYVPQGKESEKMASGV